MYYDLPANLFDGSRTPELKLGSLRRITITRGSLSRLFLNIIAAKDLNRSHYSIRRFISHLLITRFKHRRIKIQLTIAFRMALLLRYLITDSMHGSSR